MALDYWLILKLRMMHFEMWTDQQKVPNSIKKVSPIAKKVRPQNKWLLLLCYYQVDRPWHIVLSGISCQYEHDGKLETMVSK